MLQSAIIWIVCILWVLWDQRLWQVRIVWGSSLCFSEEATETALLYQMLEIFNTFILKIICLVTLYKKQNKTKKNLYKLTMNCKCIFKLLKNIFSLSEKCYHFFFFIRYDAYESFGLGSLNAEDADSVFDNSNGGYSETCSSTWGADVMSNWNWPFVMSSQRSRSPFSDSGRESQYSTSNLSDSSSLYSPSHCRPAPIGSRGRDMHPYLHRNYRGRGAVVPEAKGQDVGVRLVSSLSIEQKQRLSLLNFLYLFIFHSALVRTRLFA